MEKFIKGKWFPLTVAAILALVAGAILFFCGFRITYAPELENSWNAISAVAAWAGALGTVAILWFNHKTIRLTQRSVRQAVGLQLYEKRLELYSALSKDTAFEEVPMELKILYSEEVYSLYFEISKLCYERRKNIVELYIIRRHPSSCEIPSWNVCEQIYQQFLKDLDDTIKWLPGREEELSLHKANTQELHSRICHLYGKLEEKMENILNESVQF